jgi:Antitoxin VbhA
MTASTQPGPEQRQRAATNAVASLALEGLRPDQQTLDMLDAAVRGELTADDLYAWALRRSQQS